MALVTEFLLATMRPDAEKPSLFDLYIIEQMDSSIKPAVRHIYTSLVDWLQKPELMIHFEQFSAICESVCHWNSLNSVRQSSTIEHLRSYKRVNGASEDGNLSMRQKVGSMAYLILLPRIVAILRESSTQIKEQRAHEQRTQQTASDINNLNARAVNGGVSRDVFSTRQFDQTSTIENSNSTANTLSTHITFASRFNSATSTINQTISRLVAQLMSTVKHITKHTLYLFADLYPYLEATLQCLCLLNKLLYALNYTKFHHPLFGLLDMTLQKDKPQQTGTENHNNRERRVINTTKSTVNSGDTTNSNTNNTMSVSEIYQNISNNTNNSSNSSTISPNNTANNTTSTLSFQTIIFSVILAFKTMQYFTINNTELSSHSLTAKLNRPKTIPKVPQSAPIDIKQGCIFPHSNPNFCSICRKLRTHSAVATSGYVFCYLCILNTVRRTGACPITNIPCREGDIIKLFEQ